MADKSPTGYLPETSQEAIDLNRAQQAALARLNEALDVRKNRIFDPRWAAAAQGFWTPTRTGGWGEVLGNVIGNVSKADEAMALEEQNIAKAKFDVASQNVMLGRQKMAMQPYIDRMQGKTQTAGAPAGGGTPEGPVSRDEFIMQQVLRGKTPIEAETEYAKYIQDVIQVSDQGSFNRFTNKFAPHRYKVDFKMMDLARPDGSIERREVPEELASQIEAATQSGNLVEYNRLVARALNPLAAFQQNAPSPVATQPSAGALPIAANEPPAGPLSTAAPQSSAAAAPSSGALAATTQPSQAPALPSAPTVQEREAQKRREEINQAAALEETRGIAKSAVESYDLARKASEQSGTLFTSAENILNLVKEQPDAFRTVLNRPGIAGAIMRAANEGISTGVAGKISLPANEIANAKLNESQLTTLQMYANQIALAKNANRQMTRVPGEGAVSDFETKLMNAMLEVDYATPQAIQFINELTMLRARHAELRFETINRLRDSGLTLSKVLTHPDMQDVKTGYESALRGLAKRNAQMLKPSRETETAAILPKKNKPKNKLPEDELEKRLDKVLGIQ